MPLSPALISELHPVFLTAGIIFTCKNAAARKCTVRMHLANGSGWLGSSEWKGTRERTRDQKMRSIVALCFLNPPQLHWKRSVKTRSLFVLALHPNSTALAGYSEKFMTHIRLNDGACWWSPEGWTFVNSSLFWCKMRWIDFHLWWLCLGYNLMYCCLRSWYFSASTKTRLCFCCNCNSLGHIAILYPTFCLNFQFCKNTNLFLGATKFAKIVINICKLELQKYSYLFLALLHSSANEERTSSESELVYFSHQTMKTKSDKQVIHISKRLADRFAREALSTSITSKEDSWTNRNWWNMCQLNT